MWWLLLGPKSIFLTRSKSLFSIRFHFFKIRPHFLLITTLFLSHDELLIILGELFLFRALFTLSINPFQISRFRRFRLFDQDFNFYFFITHSRKQNFLGAFSHQFRSHFLLIDQTLSYKNQAQTLSKTSWQPFSKIKPTPLQPLTQLPHPLKYSVPYVTEYKYVYKTPPKLWNLFNKRYIFSKRGLRVLLWELECILFIDTTKGRDLEVSSGLLRF